MGFKVSVKGNSLMFIGESTIPKKLPGFKLRGVGRSAFVVFGNSFFEVGCKSDVGLFGGIYTSDDVDIIRGPEHRISSCFKARARASPFRLRRACFTLLLAWPRRVYSR